MHSNRGVILVSVLWILIILSVLAFGLSQSTSVEILLTKHSIHSVKAFAAAHAGIAQVKELIKADTEDTQTQQTDTLNQCGVNLNGQTPDKVFKKVPLGEQEEFTISYRESFDDKDVEIYGIADEERRINLNALNQQNYKILAYLIQAFGHDSDLSEEIAAAAVDWKDEDSTMADGTIGAETDYYETLKTPYKAKNRPFDQTEELLLLKGMTAEIFEDIEDYVTVFPKETAGLKLNLDTASEKVLDAFIRTIQDTTPGLGIDNIELMRQKLVSYRNGPDGQPGTADDRALPREGNFEQALGLSTSEGAFYANLQNQRIFASQFLRVRSTGRHAPSGVSQTIEAVIQRDSLLTAFWHRE